METDVVIDALPLAPNIVTVLPDDDACDDDIG